MFSKSPIGHTGPGIQLHRTNRGAAFKSHNHLFKLSLAHAIAQSTKLSIYEAVMQESLAITSSFPKELSMTGHLQMTRREALKMTGRLFKLRMDVNLIGGILGKYLPHYDVPFT